jgi:hypothetical protein
MLKDYLNQTVAGIKTVAGKIVDVLYALLDGVVAKTKTVTGTVYVIIIALLLWDIIQKGAVGIIAYSIDQIKLIANVAVDLIKVGGWQLIIVILLIALLKKDKK